MIGIIGAMPREVKGLIQMMENAKVEIISMVDFHIGQINGKDVVVARAGVGKVNAAITAQTMILKYGAEKLINIGVAGGLAKGMKVLDVAVANRVVEHDMNSSALGDPVGFISGIDKIFIDSDEEITNVLCECAKKVGLNTFVGTVASGDLFVSKKSQKDMIIENFDAIAAEMEGAAIGHVCYMNSVPFGVLRSISDSADGDCTMDYPTFADAAANNSIEIMKEFFKAV